MKTLIQSLVIVGWLTPVISVAWAISEAVKSVDPSVAALLGAFGMLFLLAAFISLVAVAVSFDAHWKE